MKHRFNSVHRPMDWAVLLQEIVQHISYSEVADIVGRSKGSLANIANDLQAHPEEWDAAFALIDLWIRLNGESNKLPVKK